MKDLIERQAAIDAVLGACKDTATTECAVRELEELPSVQPDLAQLLAYECGKASVQPDHIADGSTKVDVESKYEYHYDHTDCIWYRPEARNRCPSTCAQYRDGWNDAMNYIYRDGKGYRPYRRDAQYGE